jgi:four helix bundle protein
MEVEDLKIYTISLELANEVWKIVLKRDYFAKSTVGKQLVRAADSVPANISEGFGRFHYKEEKQFLYYARGSLYETKTFLSLAQARNLIDESVYNSLVTQIDLLGRKLNSFINAIGKKP